MNLRKLLIIAAFIITSTSWLNSSFSLGIEEKEPENVQIIKFTSTVLEEERTLSVSLPYGYETSCSAYPLLFVLDAEAGSVIRRSVSTLKGLNEKGLVPKMIVVGIWNTDRNRDMIPESVSHRPGSGGAENFLNFIKTELIPYIKQNYRASDYSILYGMSNSALFAVYALFEKPGTFNAYIASSPMIGHCPEYMQKKAQAFISKKGLNDRFLYMVYGDEDSRRVTEYVPDLQNYLDTHPPDGFKCKLEILPGEGHVPKSGLARGLQFIFSMQVSHW